MHHLQQYLPYTIKFTELGYNILMPDYRGYGKSTGTANRKNFLRGCCNDVRLAQEKFS